VAIGLDYLPSLTAYSLQSLHERLPANAHATRRDAAAATPGAACAQVTS
jgi:hypothetical protein